MNINKVNFGLRKVATLEFATFKHSNIDENNIAINLGFGFGINEKAKIIGCASVFTFLSENNPFIKLEIKCDFEIEQKAWDSFIKKEEKKIVFPLSVIHHLATITVGTARGVLHAKTETTAFNKFFIPTIDVTQTLTKDVEIPLQ